MEYRKLPRGNENEKFSVIGSGLGGIDISLVNKYYDLAQAGDEIAANRYTKLTVKADACLQCGHCDSRCPFSVPQMERMNAISGYFSK